MSRTPSSRKRLAVPWQPLLPLTMALMLTVAACGGGKEATPAPSPTAAPAATATPAPSPTTRVTAPTPGPTPTPTPVPPTPTPAAKYGGILSLGAGSDWGHLDTHQKPDLLTRLATAPGYDGILQFDPYNKSVIIPDLAERWELAADGKTLTFFFRKGVKFHDGAPFTADDVLYNITLLRDEPGGALYRFSSDYKIIQEAVAVDEATVRLKLERHSNTFLLRLAMPNGAIYPKHVVSRDPANAMKATVLGTGPFKLKEYRRAISLDYVKNDGYWLKGRPYLDGIKLSIFGGDPATGIAALRSGRIDMQCSSVGCSIESELQERIAKESGGKILINRTEPTGTTPRWLGINPQVKPYDDQRVRFAINLAINRDAIVSRSDNAGVFLYLGPPGNAFTKSQEEIGKIPGYRADKSADIAEARRLLKEVGLESGFTMTVYCRNSATYIGPLEIIAEQLKPLNITVKIAPEAAAAFLARLIKRDYGVVMNAHQTVIGDPSEQFANFVTGDQVAYDAPELKRLAAQQDAEPDQAKRKALVDQIVDRLYRDAYVIYLLGSGGGLPAGSLVWSHVRNLPTSDAGGFGGYKQDQVWLDR